MVVEKDRQVEANVFVCWCFVCWLYCICLYLDSCEYHVETLRRSQTVLVRSLCRRKPQLLLKSTQDKRNE